MLGVWCSLFLVSCIFSPLPVGMLSIDLPHRSNGGRRNSQERVWIAKWKDGRWGLSPDDLITWNDPRSVRARAEKHVDPNHVGVTYMGYDLAMSADGSIIALSAPLHNGCDDYAVCNKIKWGALHVLREVHTEWFIYECMCVLLWCPFMFERDG